MVYADSCVLNVLVDGKIVKEENGVAKVPFNRDYQIRMRNKSNKRVCCDLYIDGELVNSTGQLVIWANDYIDLQGFIKKDSNNRTFRFVKLSDGRVRQPNEEQNGVIECKFYFEKEVPVTKVIEEHVHHHYHDYDVWYNRPIWIYGSNPYPRPYWGYWNEPTYGGGMSSSLDNKVDCKASVGSPMRSYNCSLEAPVLGDAGATVEGQKHDQQFHSVPSFDLVSEAIVLKIKLAGYELADLVCGNCNSKIEKEWKHCPQCGKDIIWNVGK